MFTARIPFTVPSRIRVGDEEAATTIGSATYKLKGDGYLHVLTASGFATEELAQDFVRRAHSALAWLLLSKGVPAEAQLTPQRIRYIDDPVAFGEGLARATRGALSGPVDAFIHGPEAAIYPTDKRIRSETALPITAVTSQPSTSALQVLLQGAEFPHSRELTSDAKLVVALSLYGAHFTETSDNARFLTLIMALEACSSATSKAPIALSLLANWSAQVDQISQRPETTEEDRASLAALQRELLHRREDSIRSQVRKLVRSELKSDGDAAEVEKEALRLYDLRSTLVHDGSLDPQVLGPALTSARSLARRVLMARYSSVVGAPLTGP
jgi:hypothetical protein